MSREYLQQYAPGIKVVSEIGIQAKSLKNMERELDQVCSLINTVQKIKNDVELAAKVLEEVVESRKELESVSSMKRVWFGARRKRRKEEESKKLIAQYNSIIDEIKQAAPQVELKEYNLEENIEYVSSFTARKSIECTQKKIGLHTTLKQRKEELNKQIDIAKKVISNLNLKILSTSTKALGEEMREPEDWEKFMKNEELEAYRVVMQANSKQFGWATGMFQQKLVMSSLTAENQIKIAENQKELGDAKKFYTALVELIRNVSIFQDYRVKQYNGVEGIGIREEVRLAQAAKDLKKLLGAQCLNELDKRVKNGETKADDQQKVSLIARTIIGRLAKKCDAENVIAYLKIEDGAEGITSKLQEVATKLVAVMESMAKEGQDLVELGQILDTAAAGIDRSIAASVGTSISRDKTKKVLREKGNLFDEYRKRAGLLAY